MKDTFNGSNPPEKVSHFIFECEIFDKLEETANSREIHVEISNFKPLLPALNFS